MAITTNEEKLEMLKINLDEGNISQEQYDIGVSIFRDGAPPPPRVPNYDLINRQKRDSLLKETDWMAMSDRTMTAEQTAYRQALRDITSHENWPNLADEDWPTLP